MKNFIIKTLTACTFLLVFGGCKKYLDINDNPNQSSDPPINGLLTDATYKTAQNVYLAGNITSYFVQYLASPNASSPTDSYQQVDYSSLWASLYTAMADATDMESKAVSTQSKAHEGVAKILKAINLEILISLFGDAPFSQAFLSTNLNPTYDKQDVLNNQCLSLLDAGIADLNAAADDNRIEAGRDLIHGADLSAWIKTAYAIKARLLIRNTKNNTFDAAAVLTALSSAYTANSDDAQITVFQVRNPWAQLALNNENDLLDGWLSEQFVNATNGTDYQPADPRLAKIATLTKNNNYKGTVNGAGRVGTGTDRDESYLSTSGFYSSDDSPLPIITYAECKFIEAETRFRQNNIPSAYTAYIEGIKASMDKLGVLTADRDAYVTNTAVAVGASGLNLNLVFKEKYVAMFLNPEAWVDARRYDYKYKNFALPQNASLSEYIRRVAYPNTEINRNGANVPKVTLTDRLYFDQ